MDLVAVQGTLKSLSPTPQFKSISSLMLSFPYSPPLTSIHDYWKNYSFDLTDLCIVGANSTGIAEALTFDVPLKTVKKAG